MNISQLKTQLEEAGFRRDAYSLKGGLPNEAYCLNKLSDKWEVYYSERGQKTNLKVFDSEDEACRYFYSILNRALKH